MSALAREHKPAITIRKTMTRFIFSLSFSYFSYKAGDLQETPRVSMLSILLFFSGCCSETEVSEQLYYD
jgi:hypothetical protein